MKMELFANILSTITSHLYGHIIAEKCLNRPLVSTNELRHDLTKDSITFTMLHNNQERHRGNLNQVMIVKQDCNLQINKRGVQSGTYVPNLNYPAEMTLFK